MESCEVWITVCKIMNICFDFVLADCIQPETTTDICKQPDMFRCNEHSCVPKHKQCRNNHQLIFFFWCRSVKSMGTICKISNNCFDFVLADCVQPEKDTDVCNKPDMFRCDEHSCIPKSKQCNGINECWNGQDERVQDCGEELSFPTSCDTWINYNVPQSSHNISML